MTSISNTQDAPQQNTESYNTEVHSNEKVRPTQWRVKCQNQHIPKPHFKVKYKKRYTKTDRLAY